MWATIGEAGGVARSFSIANCCAIVPPLRFGDETLSLDVIEEAVLGPGHYLGHPQTLALMESEYVYRQVGDRARARAMEVLETHYPVTIDPAVDAELRARFPIQLPVEDMRPSPAVRKTA